MRLLPILAGMLVWHPAGLAAQTTPPPRYLGAMAYDAGRHRLVLFGGIDPSDQFLGDTWEWDGRAWSMVSPATSPSPRAGHGMVYDPIRRVVVLFGGASNQTALSDLWVFDGTTWKSLAVQGEPPARLAGSLVWNSDRKAIELMGGQGVGGHLADLWELNGSAWTLLSGSATAVGAPPASGGTHARALEATVKTDLRNLVTVQEAFFADNNHYAKTMAELKGTMQFVPTAGVTIELTESSDTGWAAVGTYTDMAIARCVVYVGNRPAFFPADLEEGSVGCVGFK